jgi:ribosomal protein S18 acetylase RimI-like enzyme
MLIKSNNYHYNFWPDGCNGESVGSFDLFANPKHPEMPLELWSFGIHDEENQGKGYGQQMLREAIAVAGGHDIKLYVYRTNFEAVHIYEKAGFVRTGNYSDNACIFEE